VEFLFFDLNPARGVKCITVGVAQRTGSNTFLVHKKTNGRRSSENDWTETCKILDWNAKSGQEHVSSGDTEASENRGKTPKMLPIRYKINKKYPLELGILPARLKKMTEKITNLNCCVRICVFRSSHKLLFTQPAKSLYFTDFWKHLRIYS
jgi:hypothetical protein